MNKLAKRLLALGIGASVIGGGAYGGFRIYDNYHGGAVNVYPVSMIQDFWYDSSNQSEGMVNSNKLQTVFISDTQTVDKVFVKEGQKVKVGDKLFSYDSTLTDLDLQKKEIQLQQKKLELEKEKKKLDIIKTYRPGVPIPDSRLVVYNDPESAALAGISIEHFAQMASAIKSDSEADAVIKVDNTLDFFAENLSFFNSPGSNTTINPLTGKVKVTPLSGDGSQLNPYSYMWEADWQFNDDFIIACMQGKKDAFIRFYVGGEDVKIPESEKPTEKPTEPPTEKPTEPPTVKPSEKPTEPPTEKPSEKPTEPQTEKPSEKPTEPSTEPSTEHHTEEPSLPHTEEATETPSEEAPEAQSGEDVARGMQLTNVSFINIKKKQTVDYSSFWTIHAQNTDDGLNYVMISVNVGGIERKLADPLPPLEEDPSESESGNNPLRPGGDDPYNPGPSGITYTSAEINSMIREHTEMIKSLDIETRQLALDLQKLKDEMKDSTVYAKLDGVVKELNKPEDIDDFTPLIKVSAGGGYEIRSTISELNLENVEIGQEITVYNYMDGGMYPGTIKEIGDYPEESGYFYYDGNSNVSNYAITISVDESVDMENGNYCAIYYTPYDPENTEGLMYGTVSDGSLTIQKSFIRSEGGRFYCYVDNGGVLEKRYISVAKIYSGYCAKITSGLSMEEYIAFPYGQNVKEGAPTELQEDMNKLYE